MPPATTAPVATAPVATGPVATGPAPTGTPADLPPATRLSRRRQLRLVGIAALAVLAGWALLALVHRLAAAPPPATPAAPAGTVRVTPAQLAGMAVVAAVPGDAAGPVQATGTISVDEERSTPVVLPFSGQVAAVMVQAGERVKRGQPLLRVRSADYNAARGALAAAGAASNTAAAQLRLATDNARRQEAIFRTAGGALKDYRQAQNDLAVARAQAASAAGALATARGQLALLGGGDGGGKGGGGGAGGPDALATYRSPVGGVVVQRAVAPGQYAAAGAADKPLLTVADLSRVWLVAQLAERDAAAVKLGDAVSVTTPAYPGRRFSARVDNVAAALDPATHRLPVRASVANPDGALKPQMFASFAISRAGAGPGSGHAGRPAVAGVLVPSRAVIHEGDTARVWLALPGGVLRARAVTVGDSTGGTDTVTAGLRPGDRVVTSGALFVNQAGLGS